MVFRVLLTYCIESGMAASMLLLAGLVARSSLRGQIILALTRQPDSVRSNETGWVRDVLVVSAARPLASSFSFFSSWLATGVFATQRVRSSCTSRALRWYLRRSRRSFLGCPLLLRLLQLRLSCWVPRIYTNTTPAGLRVSIARCLVDPWTVLVCILGSRRFLLSRRRLLCLTRLLTFRSRCR